MSKIKVGLYIDEELYRTFQKFVSVKRGKIHAALSEEASKAIAMYMTSDDLRTNTHELARKILNSSRGRSRDTAELIGAKIDELYPDHLKLERKQIEKAIGEVVSTDPRHYRKYIPMLEGLGIIHHWKFGVYDLPRRGIKKEAEVTIEAVRQAEVTKPVDAKKLLEAG